MAIANKPPADPALDKIFGWFYILAGVSLALFTLLRSAEKLTAESWPRTSAEVLHSELYRQTGRSPAWCIKLQYRYVIDGNVFVSTRLSTSLISRAGCDREKAVVAARLERLQPGAQMRIRYDDDDHERSIVVIEDLDLLDYLFPLIAILLLWGGVVVHRKTRRIQPG